MSTARVDMDSGTRTSLEVGQTQKLSASIPESSSTFDRIKELVEELDRWESTSEHQALHITLPIGFYRYDSTDDNPWYVDWRPVDIRLKYSHKQLDLRIPLDHKVPSSGPALVLLEDDLEARISKYKITPIPGVTLAEAKELVDFFCRYFRGFSNTIKTRLTR